MATLAPKRRKAVVEALLLWQSDPLNPKLRQHDLKGDLDIQFSISAGGDLRIHLQWVDKPEIVRVIAVGTHSQFYR